MRRCGGCKNVLGLEAFSPSILRRRSGPCKSCAAKKSATWRARFPERMKEQSRASYERYKRDRPGYWSANGLKNAHRLRESAFALLGDRCRCCGKMDRICERGHFCQIDHINNNGNQHRKRLKGYVSRLYREILSNGTDGFQLLCPDCNWLKKINRGICPHEEERVARALLCA